MPDKRTITEQEAAGQFCISIATAAQDAWPVISKHLRDCYKEKFVFVNEKVACYDLGLAIMALELEAVKNLFTPMQSGHLYSWVLKCLDTPEWGEYSKEEFQDYQKAFEDDLKNNENPLCGVAARLVSRWLGGAIKDFEMSFDGKNTGIINPLLVMQVSGILAPFLGYWKKIKDQYILTESDLPIDFDQSRNSPYNVGRSKVSDRKFKVCIKGPWDGIKEEFWQIDDETAAKFVDELSQAYAICYFERKEPRYIYVHKKVWDRMGDMEAIFADNNLSEAERIKKIKKFIS
jgi:hypothetical protein